MVHSAIFHTEASASTSNSTEAYPEGPCAQKGSCKASFKGCFQCTISLGLRGPCTQTVGRQVVPIQVLGGPKYILVD